MLCRAFDIVPFDLVYAGIEEEFQRKKPQANSLAAKLCYEQTTIVGGE